MDTPDLTGAATVALDVVTLLLVLVTSVQARLSRQSIQQTQRAVEQGLRFDAIRQVPQVAPLLYVDLSPSRLEKRLEGKIIVESSGQVKLRNVGLGPATTSVSHAFITAIR